MEFKDINLSLSDYIEEEDYSTRKHSDKGIEYVNYKTKHYLNIYDTIVHFNAPHFTYHVHCDDVKMIKVEGKMIIFQFEDEQIIKIDVSF